MRRWFKSLWVIIRVRFESESKNTGGPVPTVTAEEILAEAKRLYNARKEEGEPEWDELEGFVQSYYLFVSKRRLV